MAGNNIKTRVLRLKSDFERLKSTGKRISPNNWLLLNYSKNEHKHLRYGMTVSKKVGNSVIRNRLKRWIREYIRRMLKNGFDPEYDINVILKSIEQEFYKDAEYKTIESALNLVFKRLGKVS